ncbi:MULTISPECIES: helix-turn-helix domain-containing protein [Kocuria]|nr:MULTISPECIES: helix-turn-helix transcriptional regulator [Kocuria]
MNTPRLVSANVRAEMGRRSVSQKDLAAALGLSPAAMSDRLRDRVEFRLSELDLLSKRLGVSVVALLTVVEVAA